MRRYSVSRLKPIPKEQLLAALETCTTAGQIGERLGFVRETIVKHLKYHGIPIPRFESWYDTLPVEEIASRYLAGEDCGQIAESYKDLIPKGIKKPQEAIRVVLKRRGIQRRRYSAIAVGEKNYQWKGGNRITPMHYHRRQSYEVAAICLGKPLPSGAVIHHLDENPYNNNPENLIVFPTQKNHARYHQQLLVIRRKGLEVSTIRLALENGGQELHRPDGLKGCELYTNPPDLSDKDLRGGRGRKEWRVPPADVPQSESRQ
jgi:hypothetical protein